VLSGVQPPAETHWPSVHMLPSAQVIPAHEGSRHTFEMQISPAPQGVPLQACAQQVPWKQSWSVGQVTSRQVSSRQWPLTHTWVALHGVSAQV
jgi:hypothetical protein